MGRGARLSTGWETGTPGLAYAMIPDDSLNLYASLSTTFMILRRYLATEISDIQEPNATGVCISVHLFQQ